MNMVGELVDRFLEDLARSNRSPATLRAYASDLKILALECRTVAQLGQAETVRRVAECWKNLQPSTRTRKESALSSFYRWALRQGLIPTNPFERLERTRRAEADIRGIRRETFETVLDVIPRKQRRDRLLFRLLYETGLRIGEALAIYIEDLDLTPDDEHVHIQGKGGRRRTVLLDDPILVNELRRYLKDTGYHHGPLFRASKNGRGGPLHYQSAAEKWNKYCRTAEVRCTLHQLRHSHATELVNAGVSLATIRKRLGHKNIQTTMVYAEIADATADRELRAWRRKIHRS